jgi:hypothetical protein
VAGGGRGESAQDGALAGGVKEAEAPGAAVSHGDRGATGGAPRTRTRAVRRSRAFTPLKWTSFFHSCVYSSLLICAFALGKPQPETLVLGWTHGILWIGMSCACIAAARMRIVSLRLAVAVAVLGGIGPFFGSWEFVRAQRTEDRSTQTGPGAPAPTELVRD